MAIIFQVNGGGGANEIEVSDAGAVKILNRDVSSLVSAASAFIADPTDEASNVVATSAILDLLIAKGLMASS